MSRRNVLAGLAAFICLLAGWAGSARAAEPVDLSGRWHGDWVSCQSGHQGRLNARFCKVDDTCYQVRFTGTFFVVVPFGFRVNMAVTEQENGTEHLTASKNLPIFGSFCVTAVASDCEFTATYSSKDDEGHFNLRR
jgi:hypothetical protein